MEKPKIKLGKYISKCIRKNTMILDNGQKIKGYTVYFKGNDGKIYKSNEIDLKVARRFSKIMGKC